MKPESCRYKAHEILAFFLLIILCMFGALAFFITPKYEDGAKLIIAALIDGLGMVLAFMFGVHVATPPPGTTSLVKQTTPAVPVAPEAGVQE